MVSATPARRGIREIGQVPRSPRVSLMRITLTVIAGPHEGREFSFEEHDNFIVGRAKKAQFRLPKDDPYFSRNHFLIEVNPPLCRLLDMGSRNGTFVNSQRVTSFRCSIAVRPTFMASTSPRVAKSE